MAFDGMGNILITGTFFGTLDMKGACSALTSTGDSDAFMAKLDATGNCLWVRQFGDALAQQGVFIAVDSFGDIFLGARFFGIIDFGGGPRVATGGRDAAFAKFTSDGVYLWDRSVGASGDEGIDAILPDGAGHILVVGYSSSPSVAWGGSQLPGKGGTDVVLAAFGANGNHLWSKRFGSPGDDRAFSAKLDPTDNLVLAGTYLGPIDFGGGALPNNGQGHLFVAKFDQTGQHIWSNGFNSVGGYEVFGGGMTLDTAGAIIVTGISTSTALSFGGPELAGDGSQDAFLVKFDATGSFLWARRFGDGDEQLGIAVATDGAQNVIFAGRFRGAMAVGAETLVSSGDLDAFVAKLDSSGAAIWARRFGDGTEQAASRVLIKPGGEILWSGWFAGSGDWGDGVVTSTGGFDMFLVELAP
ncbi:MAG: hypothetical protein R3B70_10740 [Polyangiaceae bacterium]